MWASPEKYKADMWGSSLSGYFLSSYQSNNKSCDCYVMAKVKGQRQVKLGNTDSELCQCFIPQIRRFAAVIALASQDL